MKHNMAHIAPVIAIGVAALLAVLINSVSLIMDINIDIDNNTRSIYMVHATDLVYSTMSICVTWIIRHIQDEEGGVFKY